MQVPPAARDKLIESLGEHFAHDRLTIDEYERRVQEAYRAPTMAALAELTSDLAPPLPATTANADVTASGRSDVAEPGPTVRKRFLAFMSGVVRRGRWVVPQNLRVTAIMGGVELDLSEATLTAPVTDITVIAVMGGVVISVPPGVRLESDGLAILGGFEDQLIEPASGDPHAPVVRVHGTAIMGGVETRVGEKP